MSLRRLRALIAGLPLDSAYVRVEAPHLVEWRVTEELLAVLVELVDAGNRMFYSANSKKGARQPKPIRLPRPGREVRADDPEPKRMATPAEMRRFFDRT